MQMSQTTGSGGFMKGLKRVMGGGGISLTRYEPSGGPGMVAFAAKLPGHIVPVDIIPGHSYLVHRHGWLCGTPGITPSIGLQQSFRGGMWGGDGCCSAWTVRAVPGSSCPANYALHPRSGQTPWCIPATSGCSRRASSSR